MIRKLVAALLVGLAVAYLARPDAVEDAVGDAIGEAERSARDMLDAASREARETVAERCLNEPADCLR